MEAKKHIISISELMNYLSLYPIKDDELYRILYRITNRFDSWEIWFIEQIELSVWLKEKDNKQYSKLAEDIIKILSDGDKGSYNPDKLYLTDKDLNDIRIVLEFASQKGNDWLERKKQLVKVAEPLYNLCKTFYIDYEIIKFFPNAIKYPESYKFYVIEDLVKLWEKDIEPYIRLFAEPQQESQSSNQTYSDILPENLVNNMITKGLIERAGNSLKWLKTKALLAYFAELASEKYKLGKGEYNGKVKTAWKPFETLFGISGLAGARNDNIKTGTQPDGYSQIDELFKE